MQTPAHHPFSPQIHMGRDGWLAGNGSRVTLMTVPRVSVTLLVQAGEKRGANHKRKHAGDR